MVSVLDSDEKQRVQMGGVPWRISLPIGGEVEQVHELGWRAV